MGSRKKVSICLRAVLLRAVLLVAGSVFGVASGQAAELLLPDLKYRFAEPHQPMELQALVDKEKSAYQGKIVIVLPVNLRFTGVLKALPAKKNTGYLQTAFQVLRVAPLPKVQYQAFMGAPGDVDKPGDVIAIYMDNQLAEKITQRFGVSPLANPLINRRAVWYGYHIYNFSRGPAIVLENVELPAPLAQWLPNPNDLPVLNRGS